MVTGETSAGRVVEVPDWRAPDWTLYPQNAWPVEGEKLRRYREWRKAAKR